MVYPICTVMLIVAALMTWFGYIDTFALDREAQRGFAMSDTGRPLARGEAAQMTGYCVRLCIPVSLGMAYLQRGKGKTLVSASLACGAAFLALGLILCVTEPA